MTKSPAFQFYPADFLADENQMLMTLAEVGAYIRLICVCWNEGSIPTDVKKLAALARTTPKDMAKVWPALAPCFTPHPAVQERLVHPRLERERRKQEAHRQKMSEAGRKGGEAKGRKGQAPAQPDPSSSLAQAKQGHPEASAPLLSSSFSSSASAESSETDKHGALRAVSVVEKPEYSHYELLEAAKREAGMGTWQTGDVAAASGIIAGWRGERTPGEIWGAIHGARMLVDANRVGWRDSAGIRTMLPRKPFGLPALVGTGALFDQGDGKAARPFFDVALEEWIRHSALRTATGLTIVSSILQQAAGSSA